MIKHRLTLFTALTLSASLLLSACQTTPNTPQPNTSGGTTTEGSTTGGATEEPPAIMQEAIPADIVLDPAQASDEVSQQINDLLYDPLFIIIDGEISPALVGRWIIWKDGLEYTFEMQPGLQFGDGTPIDADAVIANFNRWFDPGSELRGSGSYQAFKDVFGGFKGETTENAKPASILDSVEKVDNLTVYVRLNTPNLYLETKLTGVQFNIVSPAALKAGGDTYGTAGSTIAGSGPYQVSVWNDQQLVLVPNEGYWGSVPDSALIFPLQ